MIEGMIRGIVIGTTTIAAQKLFNKTKAIAKGGYSGKRTIYYESGKKFGEGEFRRDLKIGLWSYFYEDGNLLSEVRYKPDDESGRHFIVSSIGFNQNGTRNDFTVKTNFFTAGGIRFGFSLDGKRKIKTAYENGVMHGERLDFHLSGNKALQGQYNYGFPSGEWIGFEENGDESFRQNFEE